MQCTKRILLMLIVSVFTLMSMAQDIYVNIENEGMRRFLSEVTYTRESDSRVEEFATIVSGHRDWPVPAVINVPASVTDSMKLVVTDGTDNIIIGVSAGQQTVDVYNLIPHRTYYYQLLTVADNLISQGHIYTQGQLRTIRVPEGGFNIRDMGGWPTADGRSVKYGKLFRGSELNGKYVADSISLAMLQQLGVGAEIDMRYAGENDGAGISPFGFTDTAAEGEVPSFLFTNNFYSNAYYFRSESLLGRVRKSLRFINSHLLMGNAVYMHCIWGVDRTGLLAMLLEGLLGVDYDNMIKDYELSYFVGSGKTKNYRDDLFDFINTIEGATLQEKFKNYFLNNVKVTQEEIDFFCSEMLEDAPVTATASGTLPVVYVSCDDSINSKYDYVPATIFIDAMGCEGFESVASAASPLPMQIRGRGNYTWFGPFEKKPYKIKLDHGKSLLGMKSNKHFALLAHADGGHKAYFRNTAGFYLGQLIGLPFTPEQRPVELVLNGEYQGIYFLTETVRVGKQRVNIEEQADYETDPDIVNGAWLVEIDNCDEPEHQVMPPLDGTELTRFCVTWHSPENLSTEQYDYLFNEWTNILQDIYTPDKLSTAWEQHFNVDMLVRYYLVSEIVDHLEAFLGSCYLHKDRGQQQWTMGPLWDFGHAFNDWHPKDNFIWQYKHETEDDWEPCILEELVKFPHFQQRVETLWLQEAPMLYPAVETYLQEFANIIAEATVNDRQRWPKYGTPDVQTTLQLCLNSLQQKREFLESQWGELDITDGIKSINDLPIGDSRFNSDAVYDLQGRQIGNRKLRHGLYIKNGKLFSY